MKKRYLRNQRGATLVELLIGIVILGIIVGPLLHTFVSSAGTAAKSGRMGDATLAGQNLAEALESSGLTSVLANPASQLGSGSAEFYDYDETAGTYTLHSGETAADADSYHLGLSGVKAGGSTFQAMVSLEAKADAGFTAINDVKLTEYTAMDAVFAQPVTAEDDPDAIAQAAFINKATVESGGSYTPGGKTRQITINAAKRPSNPNLLDVKLTYLYDFNYSYSETVYDDFGKPTGSQTVAKTYHDEISYALMPKGYRLSDGVPSIYLLYTPWYGVSITDQIRIDNLDDVPIKFFLVKQEQSKLAAAELESRESSYRANIEIHHSEGVGAQNTTKLFSNAGYNLINGSAISGVSHWLYYGDFSRNRIACSGELVSKTEHNRLYQAKIQLFAAGDGFDATPVYTFTTAVLQ